MRCSLSTAPSNASTDVDVVSMETESSRRSNDVSFAGRNFLCKKRTDGCELRKIIRITFYSESNTANIINMTD